MAHEFNYESYAQFLAILASFGMMTHAVRRKNGNWGLDAYATDENGNKISRLYAIDRMLRKETPRPSFLHTDRNDRRRLPTQSRPRISITVVMTSDERQKMYFPMFAAAALLLVLNVAKTVKTSWKRLLISAAIALYLCNR